MPEPFSELESHIPLVSTEKFVTAKPRQCDFYMTRRFATHKPVGYRGRVGKRFVERCHDMCQQGFDISFQETLCVLGTVTSRNLSRWHPFVKITDLCG